MRKNNLRIIIEIIVILIFVIFFTILAYYKIPITINIIQIDFQIILTLISMITSTIAIIIIIWDHTIDDRKFTTRVQEYYECIENFIYYFYEQDYYQSYSNLTNDNKDKERYNELHSKYIFYELVFKRDFEEYSSYLGLVKHVDDSLLGKGISYRIGTQKYLVERGYLHISSDKYIPSGAILYKERIKEIHCFLKVLRFYWNDKFSKNIFKFIKIKPKLEKKKNFYKLSGLNSKMLWEKIDDTQKLRLKPDI